MDAKLTLAVAAVAIGLVLIATTAIYVWSKKQERRDIARHSSDDIDPYMAAVISECWRTGKVVIGNVDDDGNLKLEYREPMLPRDEESRHAD